MIRIETNLDAGRLPLGKLLDIHLHPEQEGVETRFFMKHRPLFYLKPLAEWGARDFLQLQPEAPGAYTLLVAWRHADGRNGWHPPIDFEVCGDTKAMDPGPHRIEIAPGFALWAPSEWEAVIVKAGEQDTVSLLETLVRPGFVVYDVGANLGKYSVPMARLAGPEGYLYCVEANPVCVQFLRANLLENGVTNAEILPVAVLHESQESLFTVNYGNAGLGLTASSVFYAIKTGHEIGVLASPLDELVESFLLRPPDLVKIDVEGVEHLAIQGMARILEAHRPLLVLELHGKGCALATLESLDACGYVYEDPADGTRLLGGEAVAEHFGDTVFQVIARPEEGGHPRKESTQQ